MKSILREDILIFSMKFVTTPTGNFFIGIANNEKFYFDFMSDTGDYFVETGIPHEMAQSIWKGKHPLVHNISETQLDVD